MSLQADSAFAAPPEEIAQILAPTPMFARFDRASLLAVAAQCGFATYPAGTTIMHEGDPGSFALVIVEGEVDVFVELPSGPVHVATLGRNRIIGELGVFTDMPRTATIVARTYLIVVRIEQDSLMRLSTEYPSIGVSIVRDLGAQVANMNRWLARLKYAAEALGRDEYDAVMLDELADQPGELASFARAFAGMAAEIRAKQNRREEMQAAAEIQQSILPAPFPPGGPPERIDLHAEMHPAREIGGDFYDFFLVDPNRLAVTVADVSGKGIPASLFMAVSRTVMRSITSATDMAVGMVEANRLLATQNTACMFVTMFHGVLDLTTGVLRYCNAGHNPPYLLRGQGGRDKLGATGIPFGIEPDMPYRIDETILLPGDMLFLFSDGITEAFNPAGEEFGNHRLEDALEAGRGQTAAELVARVLSATTEFAAEADQSDDITCLALVYQA
ncbi:MAG TPA: SpoIIE family protein phosphatase [Stellaceae bacterium]|jgi:serine phosphatase RsbU (regulator of sigma subunit)|nr:SpoIIE family protein phosphatase [Stellaceae bacterium]